MEPGEVSRQDHAMQEASILLLAIVAVSACTVEDEPWPSDAELEAVDDPGALDNSELRAGQAAGFHCLGSIVCECLHSIGGEHGTVFVNETYDCEEVADGDNWCEVPHCSILCESKGTLIEGSCYPSTAAEEPEG
ncbi:MAG: hypothetical protein AAF721_07830 [Myxococcota bacterium]